MKTLQENHGDLSRGSKTIMGYIGANKYFSHNCFKQTCHSEYVSFLIAPLYTISYTGRARNFFSIGVHICKLFFNIISIAFQKGCGYHLDMLIVGVTIGVSSILGLPWCVAATVLCLGDFSESSNIFC